MDAKERHHRIKAVFFEVCELTPEERRERLERLCGGDESLRSEVESMLAADAAASAIDLLGTVADALEAHADRPEVIRGYRILRVLGCGGMGVVYEAQQERPRRRVALKVIRSGVASARGLRRFEHEAEILARLQHPGVAQVYEAGTFDAGLGAQPYFAMELIEGETLVRYAQRRNLGTRQRLEVFAQVCEAVHHAHQKGVIHRDLKPGNILVTEDGRPKVVDFGVARATDSDIQATTMRTEVGQLIGTLAYMSPEQVAGDARDLDTRSDVYALGVILYELLTGRLPHDLKGKMIPEAARVIRDEEPTPPSSLDRTLRGDVQTIVLHALAKERDQRYQSASALAADVRRYLNGEPIAARPSGVVERLSRAFRRHPVLTTGAVCLLMVLSTLVGVAGSVWYLRQQPHELRFSEDQQTLRLLSITGDTLMTWRSTSAMLGVGPLDSPDGLVVVIGYGGRSEEENFPLRAYNRSSPAWTPGWMMEIGDEELPPELKARGMRGNLFNVSTLRQEDVFPELPGDEIIVVFQSWLYSHTVVRILSTSGEILFQFWHDGYIHHTQWVSSHGLLVCSGLNGEAYWEQRGVRGARAMPTRASFSRSARRRASSSIPGCAHRGTIAASRRSGTSVSARKRRTH